VRAAPAYRGRVGERDIIRTVRRAGAASLLLGAAVVLTGCSALGTGPGAAATSAPQTPAAATTPQPVASETPNPTPTPTQAADGRTVVTPVIAVPDSAPSGEPLAVSALITDVIEDGGTCTITLSDGSDERTATTPGVGASSYTACQAVSLADVADGRWELTVDYSSSTSFGTATKTVTVG
jgi:hypothetical protein